MTDTSPTTWQKITKALDLILALQLACATALAVLLIAPRAFAIEPYLVKTQSMAPAIAAGALAYVDNAIESGSIGEGDVVAFPLGNSEEICVHRVTRFTEDRKGVITKGDANNRSDDTPVALEDIKGRVCAVIPTVGFICGWVVDHLFWCVIIIAITGICAVLTARQGEKNLIENQESTSTVLGCSN